MSYEIIVRPEAAREVQEAFDWYEEKSEGLGLEFLRAADACLAGIRRNPLVFPATYQGIHRALLRRFPYALFYIIKEERIVVLPCEAQSDRLDAARLIAARHLTRQCCENYIRTRKVAGDSFSGGDLKERSNKLRLTNRITSS